MPREDNLFGSGDFDAEDRDDYNVFQWEMLADSGLRPVRDEQILAVRRRAAQASQAVFAELDLPPTGDPGGGAGGPRPDGGSSRDRRGPALASCHRSRRRRCLRRPAAAASRREGLTVAVRLLRYRPEHLRRVLAIERACFAADAYPAQLFLELYRRCGEWFFLARMEAEVAGYIVTCVRGGVAEIVSIAVAPAFRRRGVGSALLRHTLRALARRGLRLVRLMVRASDPVAIRLYRRFGFAPTGKVPRYYQDGADALCMERRIPALRRTPL